MTLPFFTIGHSNRPLELFVELLKESRVELVADIRTVPRSRSNPQYNSETLSFDLADHGIGYEHTAALGGLRGKSRTIGPDVNAFWTNESFHNYADYALTDQFAGGLQHLIAEGRARRCVVMCAEAVWWRCHRRIVADYLLAAGEDVYHIMQRGHVETAEITPGALVETPSKILYPSLVPSSRMLK